MMIFYCLTDNFNELKLTDISDVQEEFSQPSETSESSK